MSLYPKLTPPLTPANQVGDDDDYPGDAEAFDLISKYQDPSEKSPEKRGDTAQLVGDALAGLIVLTEIAPMPPQQTKADLYWVSFDAYHPGVWDQKAHLLKELINNSGGTSTTTKSYSEAWKLWRRGNLQRKVSWGKNISRYSIFPRVVEDSQMGAYSRSQQAPGTSVYTIGAHSLNEAVSVMENFTRREPSQLAAPPSSPTHTCTLDKQINEVKTTSFDSDMDDSSDEASVTPTSSCADTAAVKPDIISPSHVRISKPRVAAAPTPSTSREAPSTTGRRTPFVWQEMVLSSTGTTNRRLPLQSGMSRPRAVSIESSSSMSDISTASPDISSPGTATLAGFTDLSTRPTPSSSPVQQTPSPPSPVVMMDTILPASGSAQDLHPETTDTDMLLPLSCRWVVFAGRNTGIYVNSRDADNAAGNCEGAYMGVYPNIDIASYKYYAAHQAGLVQYNDMFVDEGV
ncbi:hypothetical protein BDW22DRAFT_1346725 [Trametopsis cervina]|nr:hypothetical protein BDW22DRAFT_1346725 [Trametopsis cervina]